MAQREIELFREDMTALRVAAAGRVRRRGRGDPGDRRGDSASCSTGGAAYRVDAGRVLRRRAAGPVRLRVAATTGDTMLALFGRARRRPGPAGQAGSRSTRCCGGPRARASRSGTPTSGPGRPGWHIECAVIALNRLGMGFDVQGGGSDLIFPHHEHSAAHAEALTGEYPFARHYVHAGMIGLDGEKMSKSRGNLVFVSKLRAAGVDPMAIRLALLDGHYRRDREWTGGRLPAAETRLARWRARVGRGRPGHLPDRCSIDVRDRLARRPRHAGCHRRGRRWAADEARPSDPRRRRSWSLICSTRCSASAL